MKILNMLHSRLLVSICLCFPVIYGIAQTTLSFQNRAGTLSPHDYCNDKGHFDYSENNKTFHNAGS